MLEFELVNCWQGWEGSDVPDNLDIELRFNVTTHEMEASLADLFILYATVREREYREQFIGTGERLTVAEPRIADAADERFVRIKKPPLDFEVSLEALCTALENLLQATFEAQETMGSGEREGELVNIDRKLEREGFEPIAAAMYEQSTGDSVGT